MSTNPPPPVVDFKLSLSAPMASAPHSYTARALPGVATARHAFVKPFTGHPDLPANTEVIRVERPGARLRFTIEPGGHSYQPTGIEFERVDKVEPREVPVDAPGLSPFSEVNILPGGVLEFTNIPLRQSDPGAKGLRYITYKFTIRIVNAKGETGIIDPYTENDNPP